eukprot:GHVN01059510.1.p3 GENE.GHVN01059510.1~~GHVN01059510.1.p3  ORF type:complete len:151 (+),score=7.73 GHVN01059510.1:2681-3133(+)
MQLLFCYGFQGMVATAAILAFLPCVIRVVIMVSNTIALLYGSSVALPFSKIAISEENGFNLHLSHDHSPPAVLGMFFFLCLPLHFLGTMVGRRQAMNTPVPCRVHQLKRPIAPKHRFFLYVFSPPTSYRVWKQTGNDFYGRADPISVYFH